MMNKFKFLLLVLLVAVFCVGTASAATINRTSALNGYDPFKVSREVYDNALGINADFVPVYIHNTATITSGDSKNLRVFNGKVNPSAATLFFITDIANISQANFPCTGTKPADGTMVIIGESNSNTSPFTDVSVQILTGPNFCLRNDLGANTLPTFTVNTSDTSYVSPALGVIDADTFIGSYNHARELNILIDAGLNPTCEAPKYVQLAYISNQETASATNILVITPQFTVSMLSNLNAELDTDFDFTQFVDGSGPLVNNPGSVSGQVFGINDLAAETPSDWKSIVPGTSPALVSFDLVSVNAEAGINVWTHNGQFAWNSPSIVQVPCTSSDNKSFHCSLSGQVQYIAHGGSYTGRTSIVIHNTAYGNEGNGTVEMNPTMWQINNAIIDVRTDVGNGVAICEAPSGSVGVWFGGLEVIVPFVKGDAASGYETFVKFFNRYPKDAKLYVATFKDGVQGQQIISTTQLPAPHDVIPKQDATHPNGTWTVAEGNAITSGMIQTSICPACDMTAGIPVKFLVRVPGQKTYTYQTNFKTHEKGYSSHAWEAVNQGDPWIEGIVVSTTPTGQRSIPLEFRYFMNGSYQQ